MTLLDCILKIVPYVSFFVSGIGLIAIWLDDKTSPQLRMKVGFVLLLSLCISVLTMR